MQELDTIEIPLEHQKIYMPTKKPVIKGIIFDLGGVIMSGGYLPFINQYCLECLTEQGKKKIEKLEHLVNLGTITEQQFYRSIQAIFHLHLSPQQMHDIIVSKMLPNKSLMKFIPKLKKAKIALFTNSIGHMAPDVLKQRKVPVKKIFDKTFVSIKIHLAKPDTHAYKYVVKKMNFPPAEMLMVDDRKENIDAVKKMGMHGIIFKNTAQLKREIKKYQLV